MEGKKTFLNEYIATVAEQFSVEFADEAISI